MRNGKADKIYTETMAKYGSAEPMTGRLERERQAKKRKNYTITIYMYKQQEDENHNDDVSVMVPTGTRAQRQDIARTIKKKRTFQGLDQSGIYSLDVKLTPHEYAMITNHTDHLIRRKEHKQDFQDVVKFLAKRDQIFDEHYESRGKAYLVAIYIMKLQDTDTSGSSFDPITNANRDTDKVATYFRYCSTPLNLSASTLKEAIENDKYIKNECFINSLYDFYHEKLLSPDRHQRYRITGEKILEMLGKTEESVKNGISIYDVLPFFVQYKLRLRVYNQFYHLVLKYDPPVENRNNPPMYCMQADNHIYTLKHNLNRLEAKQGDEEEDEITLKISADYHINDESEPSDYKMTSTIDDILKIHKSIEKSEGEEQQRLN